MRAIKRLTNQVFGQLTALRCVGSNKHGKAVWLCACNCGKELEVAGYHLVSGNTASCGCVRRKHNSHFKHGHSLESGPSPEYQSWGSMVKRCTNPKHKDWPHYGGANPPVTVCERWRDFRNFLADMGERPSPVHSLSRF
jgi:hypothetical protein